MIRWEPTEDGIVVLTLDDPEQNTNTMNGRYLTAIASFSASSRSTVARIDSA
jgi:enoyl-CoA hydratase/carnithine racemase